MAGTSQSGAGGVIDKARGCHWVGKVLALNAGQSSSPICHVERGQSADSSCGFAEGLAIACPGVQKQVSHSNGSTELGHTYAGPRNLHACT